MPTSSHLPKPSDFPSNLNAVVYLPTDGQPTNALLFLPGLGDTSTNFSSFARALNLPDTLTITLQPPFPLPFPVAPGSPTFQWSDDLKIDSSSGDFDTLDSPLTKSAIPIAEDIITKVLIQQFNYSPSHIHIFGYGQGGSVALTVPFHLQNITLGSIVSIGGPPPLSSPSLSTNKSKLRTPILLLSGSQGLFTTLDSSPLKRTKAAYEFVEYHQWKKRDDSMPKSREEVLPLMQFWGRRLKSERGVPSGAVEVG